MTKITYKEITGKADEGFIHLRDQRLRGLNRARELRSIKIQSLSNELDRLIIKYGGEHPRVRKVKAKLAYSDGLLIDLGVVIDQATILVPPFRSDTWVLHGRVMAGYIGHVNLTVSLFNAAGVWVRDLGLAVTDALGYFSLIVGAAQRSVLEAGPLFLTVSDGTGKLVARREKQLRAKFGQMEYHEVYLGKPLSGPVAPSPES